MAEKGIRITVYEPAGMEEAKTEFEGLENIEYAKSAVKCIEGKAMCFIATPWDEFGRLTADDFSGAMKRPTIFDAWDLYPFTDAGGIDYCQIGKERGKS